MKRRLFAVVIASAPLAALAGAACRVPPLDIGAEGDAGPEEAAPSPPLDAPSSDTNRGSLAEDLAKLCARGEGRVDPYFSALELTQHLAGTWFGCDKAADSPLQDGDGVGMMFDGQGHWAIVSWNAEKTALVTDDVVDHSGTLRCYILAADGGASADAGTESRDISCTDPTPRNGILVFLDRTYGGPDPSRFDFTRDPTGMRASENDSSLTARYVKAP